MPEVLSSAAKTLNFGRAPAGLGPQVRWLMKSVLPAIGRALGVKISIQGAESASQQADGSMNFKIAPGGAGGGGNHNWQPTKVDATHLTISYGAVNGTVAEIYTVPLTDSPAPELEVHETSLNYVFVRITYSLTTTDGYVVSMTISAVDIGDNTTGLPSDTATEKHFLLFTWQEGALVTQAAFWNFSIIARDDGTLTSTPEFVTWCTP